MISEVKIMVRNYLNNAKLCELQIGTVVSGGIKVSDKLTLPNELVEGNLKQFVSVGDTVRLIRNHGGKVFYIVEIIGFVPIMKNRTIKIEPITISGETITSIKIKEVT